MTKTKKRSLLIGAILFQLLFLSVGPIHILLTQSIGTPFKITCAIQDPYDPIHAGRILLDIPQNNVVLANNHPATIGQTVYAIIRQSAESEDAEISEIRIKRPMDTPNYITTTIQTIYQRRLEDGTPSRHAILNLAINAMPVTEAATPHLQRMLRELIKTSPDKFNHHLDIRVYRGRAIATELFIHSIPLSTLVHSQTDN